LWLFTDARRFADPRPVAARLPRGLAGIVLRHDGEPGRAELGRALARICRERRLALVVAGDLRLAVALRAGWHLRGGRRPGAIASPKPARGQLVTSSAHNPADLRRAARAGAAIAFLAPVFPTASHPGARSLGVVQWSRLAHGVPLVVMALGGVDGRMAHRLPPRVARGAGAIEALCF
jgi:thiamine-phosphate pyrophosphorylase